MRHVATFSRLPGLVAGVGVGLGCLVCAVPLQGDELRILDRDEEAAQIRFDLCRSAQQEINTAYFIFDDDGIGMATLDALRTAAQKGILVRLVVDSQWNKIAAPVVKSLIEDGVDIRLYHPLSILKPFRWTRRMHDKLLIVDGEHLVLGGRNIEDAYFGLSRRNYIDRDVYVRGQVADEARRYFIDLWNSDHVDPPSLGFVHPEEVREARRRLTDALSRIDLETANPTLSEDLSAVGNVRFLHDPVTGKRKRPGIRADLVEILEQARSEILIESPYLVVTKGFHRLLEERLARGVKIRILTNSLQATDNLYAQAGYVGRRKKLVRMGIELWEYRGPESMHAKSAVVDGRIAMIGSYNADPRSARLNTEVAVVINDEAVARQLIDSMDQNLANAWRIGDSGRPLGYDKRYPGTGWTKRAKLWMIRFLVPFIRRQL